MINVKFSFPVTYMDILFEIDNNDDMPRSGQPNGPPPIAALALFISIFNVGKTP